MLCWIKYYGKKYNTGDLYGQYEDKTNSGKSITIPWNEIDPDILRIECTLTADLPIDKLQQINGAVLLKNNFDLPDEELIEDLVGGDPAELRKRRKQQDMQNTYLQADLKRIMDAQQMETQQKMMEMQAGLQQQMQQQQQGQAQAQEEQARQQEAAMANASNNATPAQGAMEGMTPNQGGLPPVQMARGQRG